jgi:L-ascorbate metabolism protein UlaG (beta-lactamase superfamily)
VADSVVDAGHGDDSVEADFGQPAQSGWAKVTRVFRMLRMMWKFMFDKPAYTRPRGKVPVDVLRRAALEAAPDRTLWRLGHSTLLLKLRGDFFLTDPVFAMRASPVWFAGPKRFHKTPISIKNLPPIRAVILSHDHYDHLDKQAIRRLSKKTAHFVVPRGVGAILTGWGVDAAKVREREWWQHTMVDGLRLTLTPTQHFSGRSLWNRNQTLFGSWVIEDEDFRLFYGGDSGYFEGFREIGARFGGFDVTLIENGAYNVRWPVVHMQPEETVQAHRDLRGEWLLPIHNGTFDLALHPWTEPMERIQALAAAEGIRVATPRFGQPVRLDAMTTGECWWRSVDAEEVVGSAVPSGDLAS